MYSRQDAGGRKPEVGRLVGPRCLSRLAVLGLCFSLSGWAQQPSAKPDAPADVKKTDTKTAGSAAEKNAPAAAQASEPKKQIEEDAAKLLELATALKAEVDKTSKDTLSLKVIKQAETIERLAKGVKQELKQTGGAS